MRSDVGRCTARYEEALLAGKAWASAQLLKGSLDDISEITALVEKAATAYSAIKPSRLPSLHFEDAETSKEQMDYTGGFIRGARDVLSEKRAPAPR